MKNSAVLIISFLLAACTMDQNDSYSEEEGQQSEPDTPLHMLALGDSYTIGESVPLTKSWPYQLVDSLEAKNVTFSPPTIIARTGWRTDQLIAAIESDTSLMDTYDLVSLLIGVNNQYQNREPRQFAEEFEALLQVAISYAGNSSERVIVLSIPDYSVTPFASSRDTARIRREIEAYNRRKQEIADKYNVAFFNITPISQAADSIPELLASDGLHPSAEMYARWVGQVDEYVARIFTERQ